MKATIEVPVYKHVKQVAIAHFGAEPIMVLNRSMEFNLLKYRFTAKRLAKTYAHPSEKKTTLRLELTTRLTELLKNRTYDHQLEIYFNAFFDEKLCTHIDAQLRVDEHIGVIGSIIDFMNKYDIDEGDVSIDCCRKKYYRYLTRLQNNQTSQKKY